MYWSVSSARWFHRGVIVAIYTGAGQRPAPWWPEASSFVASGQLQVGQQYSHIAVDRWCHVSRVTWLVLYTTSGLVRARGLSRSVTVQQKKICVVNSNNSELNLEKIFFQAPIYIFEILLLNFSARYFVCAFARFLTNFKIFRL